MHIIDCPSPFPPQLDNIGNFIYNIDNICRTDLSRELLVLERDYVSAFTTLIRHPWGIRIDPIYTVYASTLNQIKEQKFGCDSIIIFGFDESVKIGLFETKWPRYFKEINYSWDSIRKSDNKSRFSNQIENQAIWNSDDIVIWEMFTNESYPGDIRGGEWDDIGSTCILHEEAYKYYQSNKRGISHIKWENSDLDVGGLLKNGTNIKCILAKMLKCELGNLLQVENEIVTLIDKNEESIKIPIPNKKMLPRENYQRIFKFLKISGLIMYAFIDTQKWNKLFDDPLPRINE